MPTYRNIAITVVAEHNVKTYAEYAAPPKDDPFTTPSPPLVDEAASIVSVFMAFLPRSQFWLSYSISPPHPPKSLYYFKLYIHDKEMVSWGCSEDEGYRGKTMFGMYAAPGGKRLQRRVLCFGDEPDDENGWGKDSWDMEVKVFRASGRDRIGGQIENFECSEIGKKGGRRQTRTDGCEISLVNGGVLPDKHPQRFYKYALLDSLDQPYATFRWYLRSNNHLRNLNVVSPSSSSESILDLSYTSSEAEDRSTTSSPDDSSHISAVSTTHRSTFPKRFRNSSLSTITGSPSSPIATSPNHVNSPSTSPIGLPRQSSTASDALLPAHPSTPPASSPTKTSQQPQRTPTSSPRPTLRSMQVGGKQLFKKLVRGNADENKRGEVDEDDVFGPVPADPASTGKQNAAKIGLGGVGKLKWGKGKGFVLGRRPERG